MDFLPHPIWGSSFRTPQIWSSPKVAICRGRKRYNLLTSFALRESGASGFGGKDRVKTGAALGWESALWWDKWIVLPHNMALIWTGRGHNGRLEGIEVEEGMASYCEGDGDTGTHPWEEWNPESYLVGARYHNGLVRALGHEDWNVLESIWGRA